MGNSVVDFLGKVKRNEKLLHACPFCGCQYIQLLIQNYGWLVSCTDCQAQIKSFSTYIKSAVLLWNRRLGDWSRMLGDNEKIKNDVHLDREKTDSEDES